MVKKTQRQKVDRERAPSYAAAGRQFFEAGRLAREHGYWNAAALLFVHASIAYADAVAIVRSGVKSTSDHHLDSVALLTEAAGRLEGCKTAANHLKDIIDEKSRAAYTGASFRPDEVKRLETHAGRFRAWVEGILPPA